MQQPDKMDVVKLFRNPQRYVVPMYQRKYVWGLESQWEPLWRDVCACAEAIERTGTAERVQHFLGAIVLQELESEGILRLPAFTIIDGQQRLTTLQVLLSALRNVATDLNPELAVLLSRLTINEASVDTETERYKVWPSTFDREAFTSVIDAAPHELLGDGGATDAHWRTRSRLVEAGAYFERSIRAWLAESPSATAARMHALHLTLRDALQIVVITLDAGDDAQVIFETMNARGVPLRPSDLIRNFLFLQASRRGEDADELYRRYWRDFDQEGIGDLGFWSQEEALGRERQQRLVAYLLHFLESQLARELSAATMFDAFRQWWEEHAEDLGSVEAALALLRRHGAAYRTIVQPDSAKPGGAFLERLNTLQYRTAYPLLLHLTTRFDPTDPALSEAFRDLESWMVRRYVCRLQTRNYGQAFISILQRVRAVGDAEVASTVRAYLAEFSDDARRWPSDDEFGRAWTSQRAYRRLQARGIKMILLALESRLVTRMQEYVVYRPNLSIEHVMPVQWRQNWAAPSDDLATPEEKAEDLRDRLVHSFGNLTLLTQPLNSKNSNAAFAVKRALITKESALRLNAHFLDHAEWDEAAILVRGKALLTLANLVWPRTVPASGETAAVTLPTTDVPVSAHDRLKRLRGKLAPLLPADFSAESSSASYTLIRHARWPRPLHYEIGVRSGAVLVGLHCEFGRNDPRLTAGHDLMGAIGPMVEDVFSESEAEVRRGRSTWRNVDLVFAVDASDDVVLTELAKLVELTFEFVDDQVTNGVFDVRTIAKA